MKLPKPIETSEMEKAIDKLIQEKIENQRRCATIRVQIHRLKKAIASVKQLSLPIDDK